MNILKNDIDELFDDDQEMLALLQEIDNEMDRTAKPSEAEHPFPAPQAIDEAPPATLFIPQISVPVTAEDTAPSQTQADKKPVSPLRKAAHILYNLLFYAVIITVIAGSTLFAFSRDPQKSYFNYRFYNVLTNSMSESSDPAATGGFRAGDMIIVEMCDPQDVKVGDIITFMPGRNEQSYLTHRLVEIKTELNGQQGLFFVTRGDTNNENDPPIAASQLIGKKVYSIPKVGGVINFIRDNFVIAIIFTVSVFVFIMAMRYMFAKPKEENNEDTQNYHGNSDDYSLSGSKV